jgi:hypothetical protein
MERSAASLLEHPIQCTTAWVRGINITIHMPSTDTNGNADKRFAVTRHLDHAMRHIVLLLAHDVCAKMDLKSTVPDLCTTTKVRGINTFIHMPSTHTNGYEDNAFCC